MGRGIDKNLLERYLAQGRSLPEIGRLVGRAPGTVGYWVRRHGLVANGSARYSPKGPLDRETLEVLIGQGRSVREVAQELGVPSSRVRYWIKRYELGEVGNRQRAQEIARARAQGRTSIFLHCPRHGFTAFWLGPRKLRCKQCNAEGVARRRREVKRMLVEEAGGRCTLCGYDRSVAALEFHHRDPGMKEFGIAANGRTKSLERVRREASKCVLLCANCHAEVEVGIVEIAVE